MPASYARHTHLLGFEPNPDEFTKLTEHRTRAQREGYIPPRWKKESFKDTALWDKAETRPIYITNDTGAITLMGELVPKICDRIYSGISENRGGQGVRTPVALSQFRKLLSTETVQCQSLDNILDGQDKIDFLKIDVEGAESRVLNGARALFDSGRILFVKTEFQCVPLYEESGGLFGPQLVLLQDHDFRLLDFSTGSHWLYSRCASRIPKAVDRGLILMGDAYFALDPDRVNMSDTDLQRLGLISIALGFRSFGLSVLRDAKLLSVADLAEVEEALSRVRMRRKLRHAWERFPASVARALHAPARHMRIARMGRK